MQPWCLNKAYPADGGSGSTEAAVDSELDPDESGAESDDEHHSE